MYELIDSQPEIVDPPDARAVPDGPVEVSLDEVTFGYTRSEPVLDNVSLRVRPGETLALIGTSGSGKSTVSLLLPRFYDVQSGAVRIGPPGAPLDIRDLAPKNQEAVRHLTHRGDDVGVRRLRLADGAADLLGVTEAARHRRLFELFAACRIAGDVRGRAHVHGERARARCPALDSDSR